MGPKPVPACGVCGQPSKYRCPACPVRYCSVACNKTHKQTCVANAAAAAAPAPSLESTESTEPEASTSGGATAEARAPVDEQQSPPTAEPPAPPSLEPAPPPPLRPLTTLRWPPEPDASIFTDPLKRDDPKPLRSAELERIATSAPLRALLASPALTAVLTALDALPTPTARHAALARLLGVDRDALARPAAGALLHRSASPPPLQDLLAGSVGGPAEAPPRDDWGQEGWWLGNAGGGGERVWIGEEERRLIRLWAGVVVRAVDEEGEGAWGSAGGGLEWEV